MEPQEDIKWLKTTVNDLNNLLQVIADSSNVLERVCTETGEGRRYYDFLRTSLRRAITVTAEMSLRIGGQVPAQTSASPPKPARESATQAPVITNPGGQHELIMLVDDEELVRRIVTATLVGAGYRVVAIADPFRALDALKSLGDAIDLVILDFTLPIMDGAELFEEMRKIRPDITVMLSSGFAEQAKIGMMLARGLRGFLTKPYTETRLLEQVRSTLNADRAERTGERRVL